MGILSTLRRAWDFGKIEPKPARNRARHGGGAGQSRQNVANQQRQNVGRGRSAAKYPGGKPARTRAQMEDRADRRPVRNTGARQTPRDDARDVLGTRNYPVRGNVRQKDPTARTRGQVESRADRRTPNPSRGSTALSPKPKTETGQARRPAAALPKVSSAVDPKRRYPAASARSFSGPI